MSQQLPGQTPVTFRDVADYFSEEEWKLLRDWQKELYRNVMKDIQQALLSLGPLIAASVFSLRAKEKDTLFPVDPQHYERSHSNNRSSSDMITSSDVLIRNIADGEHNVKDLQDRNRRQGNDILDAGFSFLNCDMVSKMEKEFEASFMDHQDENGGEFSTGPSSVTGPLDMAVVSFTIKEEGETDLMELQHSERRESGNFPTGPAVSMPLPSFINEEEGAAYLMAGHGSERRDSVSTPAGIIKTANSTEQRHKTDWDGTYTYGEYERSGSQKIDCNIQNRIHPEGKEYACTEYINSFKQVPNVVKHQRTQTGQKAHTSTEHEKSFNESAVPSQDQKIQAALKLCKCSQCGIFFHQSKNVIEHQQLNNGEQNITCSECENHLDQSTNLNKEQVKYVDERCFICSECGKGFRKAQALRRHQRIHTGERPYKCRECGKSFSQSDGLVTHQRIHTGEKPYACSQCRKNFRQISHLIRHQRMHMGKNSH